MDETWWLAPAGHSADLGMEGASATRKGPDRDRRAHVRRLQVVPQARPFPHHRSAPQPPECSRGGEGEGRSALRAEWLDIVNSLLAVIWRRTLVLYFVSSGFF